VHRPPVDVEETKERINVFVDLPGVKKEVRKIE
jgi:HSP20 family molecular chaperone IbpA